MGWLKNSGYVKAKKEDIEEGKLERQVLCGKCGAKQAIYLHEDTGFIEGLVFDYCKCGERNELNAY